MKIERTEITPKLNSYVSVLKREEPFFQSPFHCHPELELVYIKKSYGKRIIGNCVEPFEAGDMVFLGPNIPHIWLNDELYYQGISNMDAVSIVVYFNKGIFSDIFYQLQETNKVNLLFSKAARGLSVSGKTNQQIAQLLENLTVKKDFDIIVGLLEILSILADSQDLSYINSEVYGSAGIAPQSDRLTDVFRYVKEHYGEDISLRCIAAVANLTPQSFCRLFKNRTKKHFVEYLNEVRVSNACKLLMESDKSMSQVAFSCGYRTVSNFNKLFKKITGLTPKEYRKNTRVD